MAAPVYLYQLKLKRHNRMGRLGEIKYYTKEDLAIAAGEASGVAYEVVTIWWG